MLYLWLKALHVIAIVAWMAGLLYLPRLFVYHATAERGSETSDTFKVMERRLYWAIMTPAMIAAWILGASLAWTAGDSLFAGQWWFAAKLVLVLGLSAFHGLLGWHLKSFTEDRNERSRKYFRVLNELPTLLMVAIVILVIVRPF